jgi:hypothetical protein
VVAGHGNDGNTEVLQVLDGHLRLAQVPRGGQVTGDQQQVRVPGGGLERVAEPAG